MQKKQVFALIILAFLVATPFLSQVKAFSSPTLQQTCQLSLPSVSVERTATSSGNYLYLYCEDQSSTLIICKVDQTTMTLVANYTSSTFSADSNFPLFVIGNYLYCLGDAYNDTTFGIQDYIVKINTSTMTDAGNFSDSNGANNIEAFGSDGTNLYLDEYRQPPYDYVLYKINPATMTRTLTSSSFAHLEVSLVSDNGTLLCQDQSDGSMHQISTSNFAVTNYYQVGVNFSANFWSGATFFGASNIYSGIHQHVIQFSYTDFSQVGEWNDSSNDYPLPVVCGNYVVAALGGETYSAIAVIDPSTMATLSMDTTDPIQAGHEMENLLGAGNFVYATFSGSLIIQLDIATPAPTPTPTPHHGGGGGSLTEVTPTPTITPTPTPLHTPSQTGSAQPNTTSTSNPYFFLPFLGIIIVIIVYLNYRRTH